ncbi:uncharacterized protein LOC114239875 [Bombyx mandarina]|uniref:Uncharacterized protein n=2 Tax=Bombyx TaxID=7090 RepID=A0A8R1WMR7_BOMMO|nr:uncharacterized protein LOC101741543 [Bombyx mori]XP_028026092.1 uncharacterized protein LOC114239875 [Bombyx mandarina]
MSIFDSLPNVDNFLFCISLKWGTVLIAILGILSCSLGVVFHQQHHCLELERYADYIKYIKYVIVIAELWLFVTSIILLIGICMKKPQTATWFMYAAAFTALTVLVLTIAIVTLTKMSMTCSVPIAQTVVAVVGLLIWVYLIIVVKSYQNEM